MNSLISAFRVMHTLWKSFGGIVIPNLFENIYVLYGYVLRIVEI